MRTAKNLLAFLTASTAFGVLSALLLVPVLLPGVGLTRGTADLYDSLPTELIEPPMPQQSTILAANGTKLGTLYSYNRREVTLDHVAPVMRKAVVAVEDARFYTHTGVDARGIARALKTNSATGSSQGASTLDQQYVKNALALSAELAGDDAGAADATKQTYMRKLREAKLALELDKKYSKDEILAKYLNIAYFGAGAYGVEAAALRYFSVPASKLTVAQAAMLTGLLKNPTGYDPLQHPQAALERRNVVLDRMLVVGVITKAEHAKARAGKVTTAPSRPDFGCAKGAAPFFCEQVRRVLATDPAFGATKAARNQLLILGGLTVKTTVDLKMQAAADRAARTYVPATHRVAAASAVVEPGTGNVKALATNRYFGSGGQDHTEVLLPTVPAFQPGSTFKVFTLAAALEAGLPASYRLPGGNAYTSRVFDNPSSGAYTNSHEGAGSNVTLTTATQLSMNTAYVQLEEKVGTDAVAQMAHRLGVTAIAPGGPNWPSTREGSFTLGSRDVSVLDMASAYATLAAHGGACEPRLITEVTTSDGKALPVPDGNCHQAIDPAIADTVTAMLSTVLTKGTGTAAAFGRPAAGKTGTTTNAAAAWFAGYTPQLATAVWLGDPRGLTHPLRNVFGLGEVYGGTVPAAVWKKTMIAVHQGLPVRALPKASSAYVTTSSGPLLPSVVGLTAAQAKLVLAAVPGVSVKVRPVNADNSAQPAGTVAATTPAAGQRLGAKGTVTLDVVR